MGAWGHGIWDNDTSCDIQLDLEDNLKKYDSKQEAILNVIKKWKTDDDSFVLMALAEIQMEYNVPISKATIVDAINISKFEREHFLDDWREPQKREKVLLEFEDKATKFLDEVIG